VEVVGAALQALPGPLLCVSQARGPARAECQRPCSLARRRAASHRSPALNCATSAATVAAFGHAEVGGCVIPVTCASAAARGPRRLDPSRAAASAASIGAGAGAGTAAVAANNVPSPPTATPTASCAGGWSAPCQGASCRSRCNCPANLFLRPASIRRQLPPELPPAPSADFRGRPPFLPSRPPAQHAPRWRGQGHTCPPTLKAALPRPPRPLARPYGLLTPSRCTELLGCGSPGPMRRPLAARQPHSACE